MALRFEPSRFFLKGKVPLPLRKNLLGSKRKAIKKKIEKKRVRLLRVTFKHFLRIKVGRVVDNEILQNIHLSLNWPLCPAHGQRAGVKYLPVQDGVFIQTA